MDNIVFFELFYRNDIDIYVIFLLLFGLFVYIYNLSVNTFIFKTYLLHLWSGFIFILCESYKNTYKVSNLIFKDANNSIHNIIGINRDLSLILGDIDKHTDVIMRTGNIGKYNNVDLYIYRSVDITRLIPNNMSSYRWEHTINDIEYIVNKANVNVLYNEVPLIIENMIIGLNDIINPWNKLGIDLNGISESLLKTVIKIPIIYTRYDRVQYVEMIMYIEISLLTCIIVSSYMVYRMLKYVNKKRINLLRNEVISG
jgi:hypothetical protein